MLKTLLMEISSKPIPPEAVKTGHPDTSTVRDLNSYLQQNFLGEQSSLCLTDTP